MEPLNGTANFIWLFTKDQEGGNSFTACPHSFIHRGCQLACEVIACMLQNNLHGKWDSFTRFKRVLEV